jgi:hypothetical protein
MPTTPPAPFRFNVGAGAGALGQLLERASSVLAVAGAGARRAGAASSSHSGSRSGRVSPCCWVAGDAAQLRRTVAVLWPEWLEHAAAGKPPKQAEEEVERHFDRVCVRALRYAETAGMSCARGGAEEFALFVRLLDHFERLDAAVLAGAAAGGAPGLAGAARGLPAVGAEITAGALCDLALSLEFPLSEADAVQLVSTATAGSEAEVTITFEQFYAWMQAQGSTAPVPVVAEHDLEALLGYLLGPGRGQEGSGAGDGGSYSQHHHPAHTTAAAVAAVAARRLRAVGVHDGASLRRWLTRRWSHGGNGDGNGDGDDATNAREAAAGGSSSSNAAAQQRWHRQQQYQHLAATVGLPLGACKRIAAWAARTADDIPLDRFAAEVRWRVILLIRPAGRAHAGAGGCGRAL